MDNAVNFAFLGPSGRFGMRPGGATARRTPIALPVPSGAGFLKSFFKAFSIAISLTFPLHCCTKRLPVRERGLWPLAMGCWSTRIADKHHVAPNPGVLVFIPLWFNERF